MEAASVEFLESLRATVVKVRHRWQNEDEPDTDTIVASAIVDLDGFKRTITIKGRTDSKGHPREQHSYIFGGEGRIYRNKRTGVEDKQFHFDSFCASQPTTAKGMKQLLKDTPGLGPKSAEKLFDAYGFQAVKTIRVRPLEAASICNISATKIRQASEHLNKINGRDLCHAEVLALLRGKGFGAKIVSNILNEWGVDAPNIIRRFPYRLMKFSGVGFAMADRIYLSLGYRPDRLKRQALCALHAINEKGNGSTWVDSEVVRRAIGTYIDGTKGRPKKAIELALRTGLIRSRRTYGPRGEVAFDGDYQWLATAERARQEHRLSYRIAAIGKDYGGWGVNPSLVPGLTEHQIEQLGCALRNPVALLSGNPGTGKTYTVAQLIRYIQAEYGKAAIGIAAPTGKAAVRLSDALLEAGTGLRCVTWHRLMGAFYGRNGFEFEHNGDNPMPYDIIIGDESSMLDTRMASLIFSAIDKGTLVLLVGDENQLLPVGHGAPFRDMLESMGGGRLSEIVRNSGGIVEACSDILAGLKVAPDDNLIMATPRPDDESHYPAVNAVLAKLIRDGYSLNHDIQVLCALNKKSKSSVEELNRRIHADWSEEVPIGGTPFRVGDKVMCVKNGLYPAAETRASLANKDIFINGDGETWVANGEQGVIIACTESKMKVQIQNPPKTVTVTRKKVGEESTGCDWVHAYAITGHKSQGSEWRAAVVVIDDAPGSNLVCNREWLYTAISRGKEVVYLVGDIRRVHAIQTRHGLGVRKTFLQEAIRNAQESR